MKQEKMKQIAIVLGGTNPHIALIQNLQQRGYYTVLIDYLENPPAKRFADEHIRESTLDKEKVLSIAKQIHAALVISACVDHANVTACYVAEQLGLPAPYRYDTARDITSKVIMKQKMHKYGIPTSKYIIVDRDSAMDISKLTFPLVVKPADSNGSKGVRKANHPSELHQYIKEALAISRSKQVIVEEYVEGVEVSIDFFVQDQKPHLIMIREKFKMANKDQSTIVLQSPGSITPAAVSQKAQAAMNQIATQIVEIFHLHNTSLLVQAIVHHDNVNVIEFAPRVGGGLSYRTVKMNTGFDILDATVDTYLGIKTDLKYTPPECYTSTNIIYASPGEFDRVEGYRELIEDQIIHEFYYYKTKGMKIGPDMSSSDRIGAFIVKANQREELFHKMKVAIDRLQVYGADGQPIMRKDIYNFQ